MDSAAKIVYITNSGDDTVSVIDAASNAVKASIKVGKNPEGIAIDPQAEEGLRRQHRDDDSVSIIDTASNTVVARRSGSGRRRTRWRWIPTATRLRHQPGRRFGVGDRHRDRTVTATTPVGKKPAVWTWTRPAYSVYVTNSEDNSVSVIDIASRQVATTIPVGKGPDWVQVVNSFAYVTTAGDNAVSVIDTASAQGHRNHPGRKIHPTDGWPTRAAHTAYITNSGDNSMSVVDPAARKITGTVKVGKGPNGIAIDPTTHLVYTTNAGDGTVSVIATL